MQRRGAPFVVGNSDEKQTLLFVPAHNEAGTVAAVVSAARQAIPGATVLVVDDGSTDATADEARRAGARVATLPFNTRLGSALQTGYLYAFERGFEYFAHLDADGQHRPRELPRLLKGVWRGDHDLVIGTRFERTDSATALTFRSTPLRRLGILLFGHLLRGTTGRRFTDVTSGFRAGNRRAIELFAGRYQPDFGEIEGLQRALRAGLEIVEVPVIMEHRQIGRSYLTPSRSALFTFKALLTLAVGRFRSRG